MMNYQHLLTTGAANTVAHGVLWIQCGNQEHPELNFVVYAVHNLLAIVELKSYTVVRTLRNGAGVITSLDHSVCPSTGAIYLTAASDDGSVRVWKKCPLDLLTDWSAPTNFEGLESSAAALYCYFTTSNMMLVAATDSKGNVVIWLYDPHSVTRTCVHKVSAWRLPPAQMAKSIHITMLPNCDSVASTIVAYIGSVDARIHIYTARLADISVDRSDAFKFAGAVAGHEEWVTCLSSMPVDSKSMFLASCSQDSKIRVWNIKAQVLQSLSGASSSQQAATLPEAELEVEDEAVEGEVIVEANEDELESEARLQFCVDNIQYSVLLESLLVGHEDWVTSVHWMPLSTQGEYRLFSTSMDRNMVIWSPDASAGGVWTPKVRMGDIGGSLGGSIGGNLLGFVGGCICPDGHSLIGLGYGGSFHLWTEQTAVEGEEARWVPVPFSTGHFASVNDLCWSDDTAGDYLTTVSADQTCRIFAPLSHAPVAGGVSSNDADAVHEVWKEISRPQIHGYDLNCLVQAPQPGAHTLYTAGEEKLIRVFDAPQSVLAGLSELCGVTQTEVVGAARIEQAYIPELGLSNKAMEFMSKQEQTDQETRGVSRISWAAPPLESQLADFTLWPEVDKMFGHNNEVMCMAMSSDAQWIASASKARDAASAQVLLWGQSAAKANSAGPGAMTLVDRLPGHESTVVCLEFAPDNHYLVSSGKDRALCLYQYNAESRSYETALCVKSAHKRIVWGCSWTADSSHFITVARDGLCKVWKVNTTTAAVDGAVSLDCVHTFTPFGGVSVTAVDICKSEFPFHRGKWLVAVGAESGDMQVWQVSAPSATNGPGEYTSEVVLSVPEGHAHGATVRRIRWRPYSAQRQQAAASESVYVDLASCGEDRTVRVHRIML